MFRFLLFLLLIGCGSERIQEKQVEVLVPFYIEADLVSPDVLPYVMEFAGYCEKFNTAEKCKKNFQKITAVDVVSSFEEKFVVGKCYMDRLGNRKIEISDGLMHLDSFSMQTVVVHEMAHCVLGSEYGLFPHYDEEPDIMNTYLLPEKIIFSSWPTLIENLFDRVEVEFSLTQENSSDIITSTLINEAGGFDCETRKN